jgi:[ribosomal protein S5]-alanine N-acetyltransferase
MRLEPTSRWSDDVVALFTLTPEHVTDAYVGWMADAEVQRFLESRFATHNRASIEAYVADRLAGEDLLLGIHSRALDRHVGNIKLGPIDRHHGLGEIGIMIGDREAWGKGMATAAIRRISGIAFEELGLRKLSAGCYASNIGSRKAFESAGFLVEAIRPAHALVDGRPEDTVLLGLIQTR